MTPIFSLLHASARPQSWKKAWLTWMGSAVLTEQIEYILCVDAGTAGQFLVYGALDKVRTILNTGRECNVDAWNAAAMAALGKILITVADDFYPPNCWDEKILSALPSIDGEYVLEPYMGRPDYLLTHAIMTRKRYDRFGYILHPDYFGMYSDNEFTDVAKKDGVIVQAHDMLFEHRHPAHGLAPDDDVYRRGNSAENYRIGREIYERRKAAEFPTR